MYFLNWFLWSTFIRLKFTINNLRAKKEGYFDSKKLNNLIILKKNSNNVSNKDILIYEYVYEP